MDNPATPNTGFRNFPIVWLFCLFLVFVLPRLTVAILAPGSGGDWADAYSLVAANILQHGCISQSDPTTGDCVPSWGGNQPPGFAALTALAWRFFPGSDAAVLVTQILLLGVCYLVFVWGLSQVVRSISVTIVTGIVLAISPQQIGWSRLLQTEIATLGSLYLLFGVLLLSAARGRTYVFGLAAALTAAAAIRFDAVLLIPVVILGVLLLEGYRAGLQRLVLIGLLVAVPLTLWSVRNVMVGLPVLPETYFSKNYPPPIGLLAWGNDWTTSQYQYPDWNYPLVGAHYGQVSIDSLPIVDPQERQEVLSLLEELTAYAGEPVPAAIDNAFARLAEQNRIDHPLRYWLVHPLLRAWNMWFNPRNSTGWPVSVGETALDEFDGMAPTEKVLAIFQAHPVAFVVKVGCAVYRLALLAAFGACVVWLLRRRRFDALSFLAMLAGTFALVKTIFLIYFPLVETRYIIPAIPMLEAAVIVIGSFAVRAARSSSGANSASALEFGVTASKSIRP